MDDTRLKDWIRYVHEQSKNVAEEPKQASGHGEQLIKNPINRSASVDVASTRPKIADRGAGQEAIKYAGDAVRVDQHAASKQPYREKPVTAEATTVHVPATKTARADKKGSPQQRVRLRPETRAQMLDRLTNPTISLHEASVILDVCPATVRRYTNLGLLPHERTTGGQRRFRLRTVLALLRDFDNKRHAEK